MLHVLLATRNAGKLRELREMVAGSDLVWHGLEDYPDLSEPEETGATFAENAQLKARYYAEATGLCTLADDSGLEVDALGGAPGVHSARYAGLPRDDQANNRKLVAALAGVPAEQRQARFRCAIALVHDGQVVLEADGAVEGLIVDAPRGHNGFGYDPHFWLPDLERTMAELPADAKNSRSHRGQALRAILPRIKAYFRQLGAGDVTRPTGG